MKYLRRHIKFISAFLTINFLGSLVAPNVAYALTSGPTAPEYTSFEPVDTTDMVNMPTGDFVYNLPLLEVPGPAGGYPLSLSYHAGILPNEEASWVGLGWTLNPGAINRTVNGYPDDQLGDTRVRHDFNDGGERHTFSVGIGLPGGASFDISVSHDSNLGFGMGSSVSFGPSLPFGDSGIGIGIDGTIGTDGYGNNFSGFGTGISFSKAIKDSKGLSYSVGVNTNFNSVSLSGGISHQSVNKKGKVRQASLVGGSISSKGLKPSMTVGGISAAQHNSRANKWTVKGSGFSIPIPLPGFTLRLGYKYMRYYIDETAKVNLIGTYYGDETWGKDYDDWSYDSYALPELEVDYVDQDAEKDRGGSFPAYDTYHVNAQGLSGSIRPFHIRPGHLMRQNYKDPNDQNKYDIEYIQKGYELPKPHFRFINDFSNTFTYGESAKMDNSTFFVDGGNPSRGKYRNGKLAGSKYIETYTNGEIKNGNAFASGFIDYQNYTSRRLDVHGDVTTQIGGYKITNESGVTYHYALPVYTYDEYMRVENEATPNEIFTQYDHSAPYAYTWLLTAITGPDFVDRGGGSNQTSANGLLDTNDWGYWVKFDYGKWTDQYFWRNPGEGRHADLRAETKIFSEGTKELYYLDAIQTKTHTALFIKDVREDAQSSLKFIRNRKNVIHTGWNPLNPTEEHREGGFGTQTLRTTATGQYLQGVSLKSYTEHLDYQIEPTKTLRLDRVVLLDNKDAPDLNSLRAVGNQPSTAATYEWPRAFEQLPSWFNDTKNQLRAMWDQLEDISFDQHLHDNVLDVQDVNSSFQNNAIRVIDLDNDHYSLSFGAPNSSAGKLTLDGIRFLGKGGVQVIPDTKFGYDNESYDHRAKFRSDGSGGFEMKINGDVEGFEKGDIVKTEHDYNFLILEEVQANSWVSCKMLQNSSFISILSHRYVGGELVFFDGEYIDIKKTKNPQHNTEAHDIWGFYKSDYQYNDDENLSRIVSPISAKNVDAWSLREVKSSLGAKIRVDYESDSYKTPVLYKSSLMKVDDITYLGSDRIRLKLKNDQFLENVEVGNDLKVYLQFKYRKTFERRDCGNEYNKTEYFYKVFEASVKVSNISYSGNYLEFVSPEVNDMRSDHPSNKTTEYTYDKCPNGGTPDSRGECSDGSTATICQYFSQTKYFSGDLTVGNVSVEAGSRLCGSGIRVAKISVDGLDQTKSTIYDYDDDAGITSGITSYEPFGLNHSTYIIDDVPEEEMNKYQAALNKEFSELLLISREVQSPGVVYEYVTVTNEVNGAQVPGKQVYNYQAFEEDFVERQKIGSTSETNTTSVSCDCDLVRATCEGIQSADSGPTQIPPCPDNTCQEWLSACQSNEVDGIATITKTENTGYVTPMVIKDYTTRVGNLKSVQTYGANNRLLLETSTIYQYDLEKPEVELTLDPEHEDYWNEINDAYRVSISDKFNNQGVTQEMFTEYRKVKDEGSYKYQKVLSKKEYYPAIMVGTKTVNHKTGITTEKLNLGFDFYSGDPTITYSDDGYGNKYVDKSTPAYHYYSGMGLAVDNGKHMLSQEGTSYAYLMNDSFDPYAFEYGDDVKAAAKGLIGASAQSWSTDVPSMDGTADVTQNIWRKHRNLSYIAKPSDNIQRDGTIDPSGFDELAFGSAISEATGWQVNSEITRYDVNSHALEAKDINENYAATRYDINNERVYATAANARFTEIGYSGAEVVDENTAQNGFTSYGSRVNNAHTGSYAAIVTATGSGPSFRFKTEAVESNTFKVSFWSNSPDSEIKYLSKTSSGDTSPLTDASNLEVRSEANSNWYLVSGVVTVDASVTTELNIYAYGVNGEHHDDFRVHPIDATMTSYVYNDFGELSYILDANNLFTHYKYDGMGRLESITRETLSDGPVLVSKANIHYGSAISANSNMYGVIKAESTTSNKTYLSIDFSIEGSGGYSYRWEVEGASPRTTELDRYPYNTSTTFRGAKDVKVTVTDKATGLKFTAFQQNVPFGYCPPRGWIGEPYCEMSEGGSDSEQDMLCFTGRVVRNWSPGNCGNIVVKQYTGSTTVTCSNTCSNCPPDELCNFLDN